MSDVIKAEAFRAVDGVDYQAAGVVSRTIIKNDAGSVTYFAFDEGEELSEHSAPYDALVHVLDGQVDIIIDGVSSILGVGDVILMPADVPHAVKAVSRFKMCLTMVRG
jgi:quercetin dioxygenase-like cupin family protein